MRTSSRSSISARRGAVALLLAVSFPFAAPARGEPGRIAFPIDPGVVDARRDLGARGDGVADDTDAIQKGIDASCGADGGGSRILFLPDGVYRVTRTLVVKSAVGPWIYGASRDGVVIRLDDGTRGVRSVLRTHPNEEGPTSADWFMRTVRNLTIDAGDNPEADGIRYFATNTGLLKDVRIIGNGRVGINAGFLGQSGPNLVQDALVEGFETGILSQWIWGQTLSRVTVRDCRKVGLVVSANAVGVEDLVVEGTPTAVVCEYPNDWTWWGGVVAMAGGRFRGGDPTGPAIRNTSILYARDVRAEGFGKLLEGKTPGGDVDGTTLAEYRSHDAKALFDPTPDALRLPIRREPPTDWELDPGRWACANDFGATAGDGTDDTAAFQRAIDAAAAAGKTTVSLRGARGPDPNWYNVDGEVRVHGSVRHVIGLGFGRILGGKGGRFVVDDESAPVVAFRNIDSFGGPPVTLINRSAARTLVAESCGVTVIGEGKGDTFLTNCPARVELRSPGQKLWARQLNPEGDDDVGLVRNAGGDLWALGVKCEGKGIRFRTSDGGRTELLGVFIYGPGIHDPKDRRPLFDVDGGQLSVAGLREIAFDAPTFRVKVRERHGGETRLLDAEKEQGWIGWSLYSGRPGR